MTTTQSNNLFTVKQFAQQKGFISEAGLRHLIFHAEKNGFHKAIKRIGRKVLIDYKAFEEWLEEINNGGTK